MPEPRHLRNAPITEAIFDFRVKARADIRAEEFKDLKTNLATQFPIVEDLQSSEASFEFTPGKVPSPIMRDHGIIGCWFKTADRKTIAQFRVDGFTFNRLQPYTSWEDLFPRVMALWRIYTDVAKPEEVIRLAVRYINRIPLASGQIDFDNYLRAGPVIPSELPQTISSFLTRVTIHDQQTGISANVAQALEGLPIDLGAVILDIDAFKNGIFNINDHVIEQTFSQLRTFKNLIFFKSLTDPVIRTFE